MVNYETKDPKRSNGTKMKAKDEFISDNIQH